jgi:chromosome segregation ATPase
MNETQTAAVIPDLDRLAERIERAAGMIQQVRADRDRLQRERDELARRVREVEDRLRGQDPAELLAEIQALKREQKEWHLERREVTVRIESLLRKLDKLEG